MRFDKAAALGRLPAFVLKRYKTNSIERFGRSSLHFASFVLAAVKPLAVCWRSAPHYFTRFALQRNNPGGSKKTFTPLALCAHEVMARNRFRRLIPVARRDSRQSTFVGVPETLMVRYVPRQPSRRYRQPPGSAVGSRQMSRGTSLVVLTLASSATAIPISRHRSKKVPKALTLRSRRPAFSTWDGNQLPATTVSFKQE